MYAKVLAHNLNDIRNWLIIKDMLVFAFNLFNLLLKWVEKGGKFDLLFPSAFSDEFKTSCIFNETLWKYPLRRQCSISGFPFLWGIVFFFSSFYWWHIKYKGWMCERLLYLQKIFVSGQNICIEVYGNSVDTFTPVDPDQLLQNVASDQGLYCLLTGISIKNKMKMKKYSRHP